MAWLVPLVLGAAGWLAKDYLAEKATEYLPGAIDLLAEKAGELLGDDEEGDDDEGDEE